jgi:hypothetical protein
MDRQTDAMIETPPTSAGRTAEAPRGAVYDDNKRPHEIEKDIAHTRVRLSDAIDALERELSASRVIEKSVEVLRSSLDPAPGRSRDSVRAYAIPLALIATGLGWLFLLRRRNHRVDVPTSFGETPNETFEAGETSRPAPRYENMVEPREPVSLLDQEPES